MLQWQLWIVIQDLGNETFKLVAILGSHPVGMPGLDSTDMPNWVAVGPGLGEWALGFFLHFPSILRVTIVAASSNRAAELLRAMLFSFHFFLFLVRRFREVFQWQCVFLCVLYD